MTTPLNPIARLDVPLERLEADLRFLQLKREAADRDAARAERERLGELAHYSHLLHDADPGAATRPFPDLCKGVSARLIDGGKA
jgi:hypothetical protein